MLTTSDFLRAKDNVEAFAHTAIKGKVTFVCDAAHRIVPTDGGYEIHTDEFSVLSRALTEIIKVQQGTIPCVRSLIPRFTQCGVMMDCSRNAVPTVETIKELIRFSSACGMNLLMLYTEDVYEIPEQPYFGYMRGRYSAEELRDADAYAKNYGIELVPCIQTLSHLATFLTYNGGSIRDTGRTLLCGEEKTYEFIEQAIRACRNAFTSKKIHIGMDEADDLGRGQYYKRFGACNKYETLCRHLERVKAICEKYDFEPMMWSDLFISYASPSGRYYGGDAVITEEFAKNIPECGMVYWDYYFHKDPDFYEKMILAHQAMGKPVWFAGGASNWNGPLPWWDYANTCTRTGLTACLKHHVTQVFDTLWWNNEIGCELPMVYPYLAMFAEYRFMGEATDDTAIDQTVSLLCGYGVKEAAVIGALDMCADKTEWDMCYSEKLMFSDPLYQFGLKKEHIDKARAYYDEKIAALNTLKVRADVKNQLDFAKMCYAVVSDKLDLVLTLRPAYEKGDKAALEKIAEELLPRLIKDFNALERYNREKWLALYKPFGYEYQCCHYGGVIRRLEEVRETLRAYLNGELPCIEELDVPLLPTDERIGFKAITSAFI